MSLIDFNSYPVNIVLNSLLKDKSTNQNIIFATDAYTKYNSTVDAKAHITVTLLQGFDSCVIQPRVSKSPEHQFERTRK